MKRSQYAAIVCCDMLLFGLGGAILQGVVWPSLATEGNTSDDVVARFVVLGMGWGFLGMLVGFCVVGFFRATDWFGIQKPYLDLPPPDRKNAGKALQILRTGFFGLLLTGFLIIPFSVGGCTGHEQSGARALRETRQSLEAKIKERPEFAKVKVDGCCVGCWIVYVQGKVENEEELKQLETLVRRVVGSRCGIDLEISVSVENPKDKQ